MKKHLFILFFLFLSIASAQEWATNFEKAKKIASEEKKSIVLVFQGSDWCAPCIKLEKEIWSAPTFIKSAKDSFVLLKADFPRKKSNKLTEEQRNHNNALAEKYNPKGYFPYVVVLTNEGAFLGATGYEKISPEAYFNTLTAFTNQNP